MMEIKMIGNEGDWYEIAQDRKQWTMICEQICASAMAGWFVLLRT